MRRLVAQFLAQRYLALGATLLTAVGYLILAPRTGDIPAHVYRAQLWQRVGFTVFDTAWYGGHHAPGYSLLYPPLGALLGVELVGAIATLLAVALFSLWIRNYGPSRQRHTLAIWLFASGVLANLFAGRIPFLLGCAFATAALLSAQRAQASARHPVWIILTTLCAAATVAASPVAGLFLGLIGVAWGAKRDRNALVCASALAGVALVCGLVIGFLFPEGGDEPFAGSSFWPLLVLCIISASLLTMRQRRLFVGAAIYCALLVAMFVIANPVGGNVVRLAVTVAPALLVLAALAPQGTRRVALALVLTGFVYAQWAPAIRALHNSAHDHFTEFAAYREPMDFLRPRMKPGERLEIPFTLNHWEAAFVAPDIALARGWERQLDRKVNAPLYAGKRLTASTYERWLHSSAVQWVALPQALLDPSAVREAAIVAANPPYLQLIYRSARWRIWKVRQPTAPLSGAAEIVSVSANHIQLRISKPGAVVVRIHGSRYWTVSDRHACVEHTNANWIRVVAVQRGILDLRASFSLRAAFKQKTGCRI